MPTTASVVDASGFKKAGVRGTAVLLAIAWVVPFAVHRIPWSGTTPLGAHLLPMFWATFVAAYFYGRGIGVLVGLSAPALNLALTGLPALQFLGVLSFELTLFALLVARLAPRARHFWLLGPIGYLVAKLGSTVLQWITPIFGDLGAAPLVFFAHSVAMAWPGLAALALLHAAINRFAPDTPDWDER